MNTETNFELSQFGFTRDAIASGDPAEIEEVNGKKTKEAVIPKNIADAVIGAYANDLAHFVNECDELNKTVEQLKEDNAEYQKQVQDAVETNEKIKQLTSVMDGLETSMGEFQANEERNEKKITSLENSNKKLKSDNQALSDKVQQLEADMKGYEEQNKQMHDKVTSLESEVNLVLDGLQHMLEDIGIVFRDTE